MLPMQTTRFKPISSHKTYQNMLDSYPTIPFVRRAQQPGIQKKGNHIFLRSKINTRYYDDHESWYTAQGMSGDQNLSNKFNKWLLSEDNTKFFWEEDDEGQCYFYGRIETGERIERQHPGEDKVMRRIYLIKLTQFKTTETFPAPKIKAPVKLRVKND